MVVGYIKSGSAQTNGGRELKIGDELNINDIITTNESVTISVNGMDDDITILKTDTLKLDKSVVSVDIVDESTVSHEQLISLEFILGGTFNLAPNEHFDFSDIQNDSTQEVEIKPTLNINDLVNIESGEVKIYSETTQQISINQDEWVKHDLQIEENGRSFDVYSKNIDSGELSSLLIEDDISVLYNQG